MARETTSWCSWNPTTTLPCLQRAATISCSPTMHLELRRSGIASTSERTGQIRWIGRIPQLFQSRHSRTRSSSGKETTLSWAVSFNPICIEHMLIEFAILRLGKGCGLHYHCHACGLPVQHTHQVPYFLAQGEFNWFSFNSDIPLAFTQTSDGKWELDIIDGWPSSIQLNVFVFDNYFYEDTDSDGILNQLPPNSLAVNFINMSAPPKLP